MSSLSARLSIGFSWVGHTYMHLLSALYLTIVLVLEHEWHTGYDELIGLWTIGSLLIGVGAPLAGWLGDRWSDSRMMAVFFLLTGGGAVAAGLADGPTALLLSLAALGLGASIYHPVGMSWLVKNAHNRGRMLGYQGIFGSIGTACAAVTAGTLTDLISWRAAFIVPGAISVATGLALVAAILFGLIEDRKVDVRPEAKPSRGDVYRTFIVLSVTMLCAGLVWNSLQVVLPKWYDERMVGLVGDSTLGVGGLVTLVYLVASLPQLLGGHLADRFPLKAIYCFCLFSQIPLLFIAAGLFGLPLLATSILTLSALAVQIPTENLLLSRFTPGNRRGLAFGAKFILTFGVGPVAVQMVAFFYRWTGDFTYLMWTLAGLATIAFVAALMLPPERKAEVEAVARPAPVLAGGE